MTPQKLSRIIADLPLIAKEELQIEEEDGAVYALGSELATLRLLKAYRDFKKASHSFSKIKNSFYFRLEI